MIYMEVEIKISNDNVYMVTLSNSWFHSTAKNNSSNNIGTMLFPIFLHFPLWWSLVTTIQDISFNPLKEMVIDLRMKIK